MLPIFGGKETKMILRDLTQDLEPPGNRLHWAGRVARSTGQIDPDRLHRGPHHSGPSPFFDPVSLSVPQIAVSPQTVSSDGTCIC